MRRTAVIDLGSNSFRLVVYEWEPSGEWRFAGDGLREPVRISAGLDADGLLHADAVERAVAATRRFAAYCREKEIDDVIAVATSAIRDAENGRAVADRIHAETGLEVTILSGEEEARYGYLAIVGSTSLADGFGLDMGGGSIQPMRIGGGELADATSLPLGAVRATERFLHEDEASTDALHSHVRSELARMGWWRGGGRLVAIGGNPRNLATAERRRTGAAKADPFPLDRAALRELVGELSALPASRRGEVPGIKADRADVILAAAVVLDAAMDAGGFDCVEVSRAGLREGVFFERLTSARP
ncbi:MAG TPA: hypothetical protein VD790_11840 [Thermoleophilaceae bacterium]|nr:hypothetical protein [Thermoleophilaceae bacterium]